MSQIRDAVPNLREAIPFRPSVPKFRTQVILFVIMGLLGTAFVGAKYVRLSHILGWDSYIVYLHTPDTSGLYKGSEVTMRGVPIGSVRELNINAHGARVTMDINDDSPLIPVSSDVKILHRSPIGEQYVDIQPSTVEGPFVSDEGVLFADDEDLPVPVEDFLLNVRTLTQSLPLRSLGVTVNELYDVFHGRGPQIRSLNQSLTELTELGNRRMPDIHNVLDNSAILLSSHAKQSSRIQSFAADIRSVTDTLVDNEDSLAGIIDNTAPFARRVDGFVNSARPSVTEAAANLAGTAAALQPYSSAFQAVLQMLPQLAAASGTTGPGDKTIHFALVLDTVSPPPCTSGYERTYELIQQQRRIDPNFNPETQDFPVNLDARCTVPVGSPTAVRGDARKWLADPKVVQPWDSKPKRGMPRPDLNGAATRLAEITGLRVPGA